MAQDLKRQILNTELEQYELQIQHYEHLYEQELTTFQSEIYRIESSHQISHLNELMYFVEIYMYHYTKLFLCQIRYKESYFHAKFDTKNLVFMLNYYVITDGINLDQQAKRLMFIHKSLSMFQK
jgi:hypothetical protein